MLSAILLVGTVVVSAIAPNCQPPQRETEIISPPLPPPPEDPPAPDPEPPDDPAPEPSFAAWSDLHGVNFYDPILHRKQGAPKPAGTDPAFVNQFTFIADQSGYNLFRIPVTWEGYEGAETVFLNELELLVSEANETGIQIWIDNHHFFATSQWGIKSGVGFPRSIVDCYNPSGEYESDPEVKLFWLDYYSNNVKDPSNSCKYGTLDAWTKQADFMLAMIDRVDKYQNVIGYEILNEPHFWQDSNYNDLGQLHTFVGMKIRQASDKSIIFTRETAHGTKADGTDYKRSTALEPDIIPRMPDRKNIIYAPHTYDLPLIETHVKQFKNYAAQWKLEGYEVKIGVGEYATQPPQLPTGLAVTQENINGFVSVWAREGYAHTYWSFGECCGGEGNRLVTNAGVLTPAGIFYKNAIATFYQEPLTPTISIAGFSAGSMIMEVDICAQQVANISNLTYTLLGAFSLVVIFVGLNFFRNYFGG